MHVIGALSPGDQLDELTYSADGYNGYFSFCRTRPGYSGSLTSPLIVLKHSHHLLCPLSGVVTFCRDSATPLTAEEGLTGLLSQQRDDSVKCYGSTDCYVDEEVMLNTHSINVRYVHN